jgi:Tol biopolymer transport system component
MGTKVVSLISQTADVGRISWALDSNTFVFDVDNRIYVYDVLSNTNSELTAGSGPSWSPNGKWVGFRSPDSEAWIIDPRTKEARALMEGRKIGWGLHWSPDSNYVVFSELRPIRIPLITPSTQLVVYRLHDGASTPIYGFGYQDASSDFGFNWVKDPETFLKEATIPPTIQPCEEP